jgi:hypothetical protein
MTFEPSWTVIIIGLLVIIGLFFALKSFAMPPRRSIKTSGNGKT